MLHYVPKKFPKTKFIFKSFKNPLNKVTMFLNISLSLDSFQIIPHVFIIHLKHYYVNTFEKYITQTLFLPITSSVDYMFIAPINMNVLNIMTMFLNSQFSFYLHDKLNVIISKVHYESFKKKIIF